MSSLIHLFLALTVSRVRARRQSSFDVQANTLFLYLSIRPAWSVRRFAHHVVSMKQADGEHCDGLDSLTLNLKLISFFVDFQDHDAGQLSSAISQAMLAGCSRKARIIASKLEGAKQSSLA